MRKVDFYVALTIKTESTKKKKNTKIQIESFFICTSERLNFVLFFSERKNVFIKKYDHSKNEIMNEMILYF